MRLVRLSALALGIALGSLSLPAAAWAAPPTFLDAEVVRGEVMLVGEPRFAGNTTHVQLTETATASGGLESSVGQPLVTRLRCVYVGTEFFLCHGEQTFTGTIDGRSLPGTSTSKLRFRCSQVTLRCEGSSTIIDADGGLAGVRGGSTFTSELLSGVSQVRLRLVGV